MNRRKQDDDFIGKLPHLCAILIGMLSPCAPVSLASGQVRPNIVVIYADDLGYGDVSCYNPEAAYETPRLDQMAREGVLFADAHAPCTICSPSRYGLYSGQLVCRTGRRPSAFEGPGGPSYIKPGELSIADMVRTKGYRTGVFATVASVVGYELPDDVAVDSFDMLPVMLGIQDEDNPVRPYMLTQSFHGEFQLRHGNWKYLNHMGSGGNNYAKGILREYALPETAPEATGQLYSLAADPGETANLFFAEPEKRRELRKLLEKLTDNQDGRSAPKNRKPIGAIVVPDAGAESFPDSAQRPEYSSHK